MKKSIIIVLVLLCIGAGSFYGGLLYAKSQPQQGNGGNSRLQQGGGANGSGRSGMRGNANGGFVSGDILSKDDKSITVKIRTGGSKIVFVSDATKVAKMVEGALSDVVVGQQVTVTGDQNSDGSISAQSLQIRPAQVPSQNRVQ